MNKDKALEELFLALMISLGLMSIASNIQDIKCCIFAP